MLRTTRTAGRRGFALVGLGRVRRVVGNRAAAALSSAPPDTFCSHHDRTFSHNRAIATRFILESSALSAILLLPPLPRPSSSSCCLSTSIVGALIAPSTRRCGAGRCLLA